MKKNIITGGSINEFFEFCLNYYELYMARGTGPGMEEDILIPDIPPEPSGINE